MTKVEEKLLRESIQRTFEAAVLAKSAKFVHQQVQEAMLICKINGIRDYDGWINYNAKNGGIPDAESKGTGAGTDVAKKQNGRKGHA